MIKTKKLLKDRNFHKKTKKIKKNLKGGTPRIKDLTKGLENQENAKFLKKQKYNSISVRVKFIISNMIPYNEDLDRSGLLSEFSPSSYNLTYKTGDVFSVKLYGDLFFIYDETTTYDIFNFLLLRYTGFTTRIKRNNAIIHINNIEYYLFINRVINGLLGEGFIVREQPSEIFLNSDTGLQEVRKEIYFSQQTSTTA
jgi:hypothetical protein